VTAEYEPTDAQRSLVESASAFGITQAEIATQLKISEPTLRKHFREELDGGGWLVVQRPGLCMKTGA
jgi:DNA-binding NarL/FixJ family response regulator